MWHSKDITEWHIPASDVWPVIDFVWPVIDLGDWYIDFDIWQYNDFGIWQ